MLKSILQSFLPWILFFLFTGESQTQSNIAIIVAALTSIFFELRELRKGFILSWGTLLFFIFMLISVVLFKNQWINKNVWLFSNGTLAAIAWFSILVRRPFTIQYAKEQVSEDKWHHPLFLKINYLLSATWGIIFLIGLTLHIFKIYYPGFNGWIFEVITYIPSIFGIWFTTWFPEWYKMRQRCD